MKRGANATLMARAAKRIKSLPPNRNKLSINVNYDKNNSNKSDSVIKSPTTTMKTLKSPTAAITTMKSPNMTMQSPILKKSPNTLRRSSPGIAKAGTSLLDKLPGSVHILVKMFNALDRTIVLLAQRNQKSFLKRVNPGIEEAVGKIFSEEQLGQILTIFPNAYILDSQLTTVRKSKTSSVIGARMGYDICIEINTNRELYLEDNEENDGELNSTNLIFQGHFLEKRQDLFLNKLFEWVTKNNNHIKSENEKKIKSISDIPAVKMPTCPVTTKRSNDIFLQKINKRPLQDLSPTKSDKENCSQYDLNHLLKKVREKEKERLKFEEVVGTSEEQRHRRLVQHLPTICDALHSYFAHNMRSTVFYQNLIEELVKTTRCTHSKTDMMEILEILLKEVPEWCSKDFVINKDKKNRKEVLFKIDKKAKYGVIRKRICKLALDSKLII